MGHGGLTLAGTAGLTSVSGNGTGTVTLTGSIDQLNAAIDGLIYRPAIDGLIYRPALDYNGKDKLSIALDDGGNSGTSDARTAATLVPIIVTAVNDAPSGTSKTVTATEDAGFVFTAADFGFTDVDGNALKAVKLETLPASGVLKLDGVTLSAATSVDAALILAGKLTYVPAANANGAALAVFTFKVQDTGGGSDTDLTANSMTIDVTAVNDAPTLDLDQVKASLKESADTSGAIKIADLTIGDVDGGTNTLSLSGADKDLFVFLNGDLYLKAGAKLDFETNPVLDVTVRVDDASVGITPDASVSLSVAITNVAETINGNSKPNRLTGTGADETINGKGGNDTIKGGGGDDIIRGGSGADKMTGGAGADVFVFKPGDMPKVQYIDLWLAPVNGKYDLITDFQPGVDVIDLSALDANSKKSGNQAFHFEGEGGFSGSRGELVYEFYGTKPAARHTIIKGDTNGDGDFDFRIVLKGHHHLDANDFIL